MAERGIDSAARPRGVTAVVVLTYLSGILNVIGGLVAVLLAVTVVMALQIVGGIVTATGGQAQVLNGVVQILVAVAVLGLLWSGPAKDFFRN